MTASVRATDAARIARSFAVAEPTAVAITKIDETDAPSGLVHATHASRLPLSVLTAGQRVPDPRGYRLQRYALVKLALDPVPQYIL